VKISTISPVKTRGRKRKAEMKSAQIAAEEKPDGKRKIAFEDKVGPEGGIVGTISVDPSTSGIISPTNATLLKSVAVAPCTGSDSGTSTIEVGMTCHLNWKGNKEFFHAVLLFYLVATAEFGVILHCVHRKVTVWAVITLDSMRIFAFRRFKQATQQQRETMLLSCMKLCDSGLLPRPQCHDFFSNSSRGRSGKCSEPKCVKSRDKNAEDLKQCRAQLRSANKMLREIEATAKQELKDATANAKAAFRVDLSNAIATQKSKNKKAFAKKETSYLEACKRTTADLKSQISTLAKKLADAEASCVEVKAKLKTTEGEVSALQLRINAQPSASTAQSHQPPPPTGYQYAPITPPTAPMSSQPPPSNQALPPPPQGFCYAPVTHPIAQLSSLTPPLNQVVAPLPQGFQYVPIVRPTVQPIVSPPPGNVYNLHHLHHAGSYFAPFNPANERYTPTRYHY